MDFEIDASLDFAELKPGETVKVPQIKVNPYFNPFHKEDQVEKQSFSHKTPANKGLDQWEKLFPKEQDYIAPQQESLFPTQNIESALDDTSAEKETAKYYQLQQRYILTPIKNGTHRDSSAIRPRTHTVRTLP